MFTVRYIVKWLQIPPIPDCIPLCSPFHQEMVESISLTLEFGLSVWLFLVKETLRNLMQAEAWKLLVLWACPFLTAESLFATTHQTKISLLQDENTWDKRQEAQRRPLHWVFCQPSDMWVNYPVVVCLGCYNEILETEWLYKQQTFISYIPEDWEV